MGNILLEDREVSFLEYPHLIAIVSIIFLISSMILQNKEYKPDALHGNIFIIGVRLLDL